jgi:hypothetical protein
MRFLTDLYRIVISLTESGKKNPESGEQNVEVQNVITARVTRRNIRRSFIAFVFDNKSYLSYIYDVSLYLADIYFMPIVLFCNKNNGLHL